MRALTTSLAGPDGLVRRTARQVLPRSLRERFRSVSRYPKSARLTSDLTSFRMHRRLENLSSRWDPSTETVELRLRPLGGLPVHVRPRSSDRWVLRDVFLRRGVHLPPPPLDEQDLRCIWDLGSNVGLTVAHMAARFPRAKIYGVELDEENAKLARRNVAAWGDRCEVIRGAVWAEDGEVGYAPLREGDELSFSASADTTRGDDPRVPAWSLNTLFGRYTPDGAIDYVKMDIEGAEREVLTTGTEWARRVRGLRVEVHDGYALDDCARDLQALGFETSIWPGVHGPVTGVRPGV